jgi:SAM-dependent methyltransferase
MDPMALIDKKLGSQSGWTNTDPALLQAAGEVSIGFAQALKTNLAPALGLSPRRFLDVGVGVAALSIEMARLWPELQIVGIDPLEAALVLARENVRRAGLESRIELRQQRGEDLTDREAFDLAWIPGLFVPEEAVAGLVSRVREALVPGGWLLYATARSVDDPVTRRRVAGFGGWLATPEQVQERLVDFAEVRVFAGSPQVATVAARVKPRR